MVGQGEKDKTEIQKFEYTENEKRSWMKKFSSYFLKVKGYYLVENKNLVKYSRHNKL